MFMDILNVIAFILSAETWTKIFTVSKRIKELEANGEIQIVRDAMSLGMEILFPAEETPEDPIA